MKKETLMKAWAIFYKTAILIFTSVLAIHVLVLLWISYASMEFLVLEGLDVTEWGYWGRLFSLIPYFFIPVTVAGCRAGNFLKTKMKNLEGVVGIDTQN